MNDLELIKTAQKVATDTGWFHGTSESIFNRLDRIQDLLGQMRMAASSPNVYPQDLERYASLITELDEERDQLERLAGTYVDFDTEEYLQSLPGGTIASEYRLTEYGTADLGSDDGSLLYRTASNIQAEYREADWVNFVTAGAETWTEDQNERLLRDYTATREAAVFYVEQKTLPILDVVKRASIIDNFVQNVEICRRAYSSKTQEAQDRSEKKVRLAANFTQNSLDDSFGDKFNWF
jgi:hypothetical protein